MSTDREKRGLQGRVRSVKTETAEFTNEDDQFSEKPWLAETATFDEEGQLIETAFHNALYPDCSSKQTFLYDTSRKLIEQSFYYLNRKPSSKTLYIYDSEDRLVGESCFDADQKPSGKTLYIYDSKDRLVGESCFDADQKPTGKREFTYHANGEKAEEIFFDYSEHPR